MIRIPLTQGLVAVVDDEDGERVWARSWHAQVKTDRISAYAGTNVRRGPKASDGYRWVSMHRFILGEPDGVIDHIDGDGLNNQRANLRVCTQSENMRNRRAWKDGTSRFLGVRHQVPKKWGRHRYYAMIGKRRLGAFDTEEQAAHAYDAAAIVEHGEFARLNFPDHHCDFQKRAAEAY